MGDRVLRGLRGRTAATIPCELHDRGVHDHRLAAARADRTRLAPRFIRQGNAPPGPFLFFLILGQQPFDAFLANPPAPSRERRRVDRRRMLEEGLAAEMLE